MKEILVYIFFFFIDVIMREEKTRGNRRRAAEALQELNKLRRNNLVISAKQGLIFRIILTAVQ